MSLIVPPASLTGTLQYYWVDSVGNVRNLNKAASPTVWVSAGSVNLGTPEFDIADDKLPQNPGKLIRHINTSERLLEIPITFNVQSLGELALLAEQVHGWFDTGDENAKRPGYFRVVRPDESVRQIAAYYKTGLNGDLGEGGVNWVTYVVQLYCPDPNPTEAEETVSTRSVAQANSFTILNQGKLNAYPIWKVTGPFTTVNFYNSTLDLNMGFTLTLTAGQYLIVDTRPAELRTGFSVYDQSGVNRFSTIGIGTPVSVLWPLRPGTNNISVTFGSGTTGATTVELRYLARYRSLLR